MSSEIATNTVFIESAIRLVANVGIENLRTRDVAELTGYSEATMYRFFPTKDILLRDAFLYVDKKFSDLLTHSKIAQNTWDGSFDLGVLYVWRKIYRHLVTHKEETIFLIRYRYSSLYTPQVRAMRQAYNGAFTEIYKVFEERYGNESSSYQGFMFNYIFEMTLCFAEKIITEKLVDSSETEERIWLAIRSAVFSWVSQQRESV